MYSSEQVDAFVTPFLEGAERDQVDPILNACKEVYKSTLDNEDGER